MDGDVGVLDDEPVVVEELEVDDESDEALAGVELVEDERESVR